VVVVVVVVGVVVMNGRWRRLWVVVGLIMALMSLVSRRWMLIPAGLPSRRLLQSAGEGTM